MAINDDGFDRFRAFSSINKEGKSKKGTCCVVYNVDAIIDEVAIKVIKFGHIRRIWI